MTELKYEILDITDENVDDYFLFCQKSKRKEEGYKNKVKWFKEQFKKGLRTKLVGYCDVKKGFASVGFIEYAPGEHAWRGIDAKGWMVIHCVWIIGKHKRQGLGSRLLEECAKDAKEMNGIAVVISRKHWLPNEKLFLKNGFVKVDEMPPFELYANKFKSNAALPKFYPVSKKTVESYGKGLTILESPQCPYSYKVVKRIKEIAEEAKVPAKVKPILTCEEAQKNGVHPYGTFCVILNGKVISYSPGVLKEIKETLKTTNPNT